MLSIYRIIFIALLALMTGCATISENDPSRWPAKRFYDEAQEAIRIGDYETAIKHLEDLEVRHPFSPYTQQGQLEIAYVYYKFEEPDSAISSADRFIKLYPRNPNVDYAYYLKGLVSFDRSQTDLDISLGLDATKRNPKSARDAFHYFAELTRRFPDSRYSNDARRRMIHLRNNLAAHEIHVAEHYLERKAYVAAANRAKYVLENYPQTPAVSDSLVVLVKSYRALEMNDLAEDSLRVLKLNYPKHASIKELSANQGTSTGAE